MKTASATLLIKGATNRVRRWAPPTLACVLTLLACAGAAHAQTAGDDTGPPRTRVALGPQFVPTYPGSNKVNVRPLVDVAVARGSEEFEFEAADEGFTLPLFRPGPVTIGPAFNIATARRRSETGPGIDEVGLTVELGGFANVWLAKTLRIHGELRKAVNGHGGLIGDVGLDYVARDGDRWLFAIGPRLAISDATFQDAYFRVTPREAAATGLAVYDPGSGVHAVGATATTTYQFTPRWGVFGYAKYDRLIGDAGDSPIARSLGSRNQLSGGLALSYTFGRGMR